MKMKRIMIFGGTTEGRELAEKLAAEKVYSMVFVATGYGEHVMPDSPYIEVERGRLGVEEMKTWMECGQFAAVVDATHPFAREVSRNILSAAKDSTLPLFRCTRKMTDLKGRPLSHCVTFDSAVSCAEALVQTDGRILLTTGSKELPLFCADKTVRRRLFVRVLPGRESLNLCYENGLEGKQIMAMQGPFSEEMNLVLIRQTGARILVTKESGHTGGTDTKITAAVKAGIACYVIRRPDQKAAESAATEETGNSVSKEAGFEAGRNPEKRVREGSLDELLPQLREIMTGQETEERPEKRSHNHIRNHSRNLLRDSSEAEGDLKDSLESESPYRVCEEIMKKADSGAGITVTLVGTGMGSPEGLTGEAAEAIRTADYVLGAPRMIRPYQDSKRTFPYFTAEKVCGFIRCLSEKYLSKECLSGKDTSGEWPSKECVPEDHLPEKKKGLPVRRINKVTGRQLKAVVLFSGDTGFYSGTQKLLERLRRLSHEMPELSVRILPGISSVSALSARTGYSWQDACILSTHGIDEKEWSPVLCETVRHTEKTFVLTSGAEDVRSIARQLCEDGLSEVCVFAGYRLSYEEERIIETAPEELTDVPEEGLYTLLIVNEHPSRRRLTPGLPDDEFERIVADEKDKSPGSIIQRKESEIPEAETESAASKQGRTVLRTVPMTKEEIRDISVARLHLTEGAVVYDIGSGTGSVTCEIAGLSPTLKVFAFECRAEAAELTRRNVRKYGLRNVTLMETKAPLGMEDLPAPTHVFIGGSGGSLREILRAVCRKNPTARVVLNAVSLETVSEILSVLPVMGVEDEDIIQVSVSRARKAGRVHLMQAGNPVFIISFHFSGGKSPGSE